MTTLKVVRITLGRGAFYPYIEVNSDGDLTQKIYLDKGPLGTALDWSESIKLALLRDPDVIEFDWGYAAW